MFERHTCGEPVVSPYLAAYLLAILPGVLESCFCPASLLVTSRVFDCCLLVFTLISLVLTISLLEFQSLCLSGSVLSFLLSLSYLRTRRVMHSPNYPDVLTLFSGHA